MTLRKLVGHGFVAPPDILPDEYILGASNALPFEVIQDNGDWRWYLPEGEPQARLHFDTYGCTIYNTLKPIEILERKLFNEQNEYSERDVYIGTGTRPPGNNPHIIPEWIRDNGLVPETMLPFTDLLQDLNEYASPNPLTQDFIDEGKRWLAQKSLGHEWVATDKHDPKETQARIKAALRTSPVGVSVVAWKEKNGVYYKDQGEQDNHWTCVIAYDRDIPIVFDSYEPFIKKLAPYYDFGFAKRYRITRNIAPILKPQRSFFSLFNWFTPQLKNCSL